MNGIHQVLTLAVDINLIGDDIGIIERNSRMLLNAYKGLGLAVNIRKNYVNGIRTSLDLDDKEKICNLYEKLKNVDSLVTNQNYIQDEIKCRMYARNSCYYLIQIRLSYPLVFKNMKIKTDKTNNTGNCAVSLCL